MLCNFIEVAFIVFWVAINFFVLLGLLKIFGLLEVGGVTGSEAGRQEEASMQ